MKSRAIPTEHFAFDGRGPSLVRWLHYSDLLFAGSFWPNTADKIYGAEYGIPPTENESELPSRSVAVIDPALCPRAWVVFHGLQVIQFIPEEVHSNWHYESGSQTGVWEIIESEWLASFSPRHLTNHKHFVLEFYDDLVEVIALDLIFGRGEFSIDRVILEDGRFAYAYLRRAQTKEKAEDWAAAIADYRSYAELEPEQANASDGLRCAKALEPRLR